MNAPLQAIYGQLELAQRQALSEKAAKQVSAAHQEAEVLTEMVKSLLEGLSKALSAGDQP